MAISYNKVGWDTTKYFNPSNMNHMDDGIKAACDKADANETAISNVSKKTDENAKAIEDANSNLSQLTISLGTLDDNVSLENHLKDIFQNKLPAGSYCRGTFVWQGTRTFEAYIYSDRRYGRINVTNWSGAEYQLICDAEAFYFQDFSNNGTSQNVEMLSSYVDTYNEANGVLIFVQDDRIKKGDSVSNVSVFDAYGRGACTHGDIYPDIPCDGCMVLDVRNLNRIGNVIYRVRYTIYHKQV